jgi:ubiquinone/menaquinone biosynthesis C-methylase UbiE
MHLLRDRELASAFDRAAAAYDRLVAVNPGYHSQLRRSARRLAARSPGSYRTAGSYRRAGSPRSYGSPRSHGSGTAAATAVPRVLDLGCGTGASTAALARALPGAHITAADASAGMLERARAKPWPDGVEFVHTPAENLAEAGVTGPFDAVFAAYLFRNVAAPDAVLPSLRRLLVPGGVLGVHEYTLTGAWAHRALWTALCRGVVVPAGTLCGDGGLYRHLWRSVRAFDTAAAFAARLRRAGFAAVRVLPVTGWQWGVVHTFLAQAPYAAPEETSEGRTQ